MMSQKIIEPPISKKIKAGRVNLKSGQAVGEHLTGSKEELLVILAGQVTVIIEGHQTLLNAQETIYIGPNKKHNVINKGKKLAEYIYVTADISGG